MDHAEARELLEIAAVEPGGFARLVAGDTPEAAALAGHLAGCPACAAEMERLRRSAAVIRDAVRLMPPPELRERTLAMVAAVGRPRGQGAAAAIAGPATQASEPVALETARGSRLARGPRPAMWLASLAAAIVIAVVGTAVFVGGSRDRQIEDLREVAAWTIRVDRQADARHVALTAAAGGGPTGTLIFSPSSTDVVVVATSLTPPAAGMEYRCWVETGGTRQRVGRMFLGAGLAYWVGSAPSLTGVGAGATFGISLVPLTGDSVGGEPVLVGQS
jgi:Anti-sigma-K factor rskA